MGPKEKTIIDAAVQVFLRYGVKRASMQDIAGEAGIARQTLYNTYANKDDILRAAIRHFNEVAIAAIRAEMGAANDLNSQIRLVFDEMALKPYAMLHASPNAQDLIEGFNEAGRTELEEAALHYRGLLGEVLAPHAPALAVAGLTPEGLAEVLQRAAAAFKYQAESEAHLARLLDGLAGLAASAAGDAPARLLKAPQKA